MGAIRPIRTEEDYEAALARISELMDALSPPEGQIEDEDDPERLELDVLSDLVERYEDKHYPTGFPSITAAIEFQMDQMDMTQRDLIPFLGSSAKVSEVLSGKRSITMAMARERGMSPGRSGAVTPEFLREVARLSTREDGPGRARDFLAGNGIGLEYVPHLPRTHLDGAALRLPDGRPVVGLTLRYDRIDNFWFTLLHELGHVGLHLGTGSDETGFVDDLSLRGVESGGSDPTEHEADQFAQDALTPRKSGTTALSWKTRGRWQCCKWRGKPRSTRQSSPAVSAMSRATTDYCPNSWAPEKCAGSLRGTGRMTERLNLACRYKEKIEASRPGAPHPAQARLSAGQAGESDADCAGTGGSPVRRLGCRLRGFASKKIQFGIRPVPFLVDHAQGWRSNRIDRAGRMAAGSYQGKPPPIQTSRKTWPCNHSRKAKRRSSSRNLEQHIETIRPEGVILPMKYTIVIEQSPNNYAAYVPDLPGCVATASTREELLKEIREAIEFHIEGMREDGEPVPEPQATAEVVEVAEVTEAKADH